MPPAPSSPPTPLPSAASAASAQSTQPVSFDQVDLDQAQLLGLAAPESPVAKPQRADWSLLAGVLAAAGALWATARVSSVDTTVLLQPGALALVLGGTMGAVLVTTPGADFAGLAKRLRTLLWDRNAEDRAALADEILRYVRVARVRGLLQIEASADAVENPVLREGLLLAVDGMSREEISTALELQLRTLERRYESDARVLESAGGFAPAIGVMGTVMGLLNVMSGFTDLASVASGAGVAFVATLYGLGAANLVLLPLANRIRAKGAQQCETGEMAMEGVLCLRDGLAPRLIRERLRNYLND